MVEACELCYHGNVTIRDGLLEMLHELCCRLWSHLVFWTKLPQLLDEVQNSPLLPDVHYGGRVLRWL